QALAHARESLVLSRDIGHLRTIVLNLQLLAHVTADRGQAEPSVRLFGAVEALQGYLEDKRLVTVVLYVDPSRTESCIAKCRAQLTPAAFDAGWAAGKAMTTDEAVAFALSVTSPHPSAPVIDGAGLSPREIEVLRLIADGHSNQQIAAELVLSLRTVE